MRHAMTFFRLGTVPITMYALWNTDGFGPWLALMFGVMLADLVVRVCIGLLVVARDNRFPVLDENDVGPMIEPIHSAWSTYVWHGLFLTAGAFLVITTVATSPAFFVVGLINLILFGVKLGDALAA